MDKVLLKDTKGGALDAGNLFQRGIVLWKKLFLKNLWIKSTAETYLYLCAVPVLMYVCTCKVV